MIPYLNFEWGALFHALLRPSLLRPDLRLGGLAELSVDILKEMGVTHLILDLDQTLARHGQDSVHPPLEQAFARLRAAFVCCVLSNPPKPGKQGAVDSRYRRFEERYGLPVVVAQRKKPHAQGFRMAMARLDAAPSSTAMVGDRVLTDVLGARLCGLKTVLLEPIDPQDDPSWLVSLPRKLERALIGRK